jgi:hypothetical protein
MVITVISKDKLSLSMFLDFYKTLYDSGIEVLDMNSLVGGDIIDILVKNFVGTHLNRAASDSAALIIKIKAKRDLDVENLPGEIIKKSDYIIRLDTNSPRPVLLHAKDTAFDPVLDRFAANLKN